MHYRRGEEPETDKDPLEDDTDAFKDLKLSARQYQKVSNLYWSDYLP